MSQQESGRNPFEAIERAAGGILGVAGLHIEKSRMIGWRTNERFPMMSVYKLPVAVRAISLAERGFLPWNKMLKIPAEKMNSGHSPIRDRHPEGAIVTIGQLLEAMIVESDNTASDIILDLSGGAEAHQQDLDRFHLNAIRIDRSETEMGRDFEKLGPHGFAADERDSATPEAMALFLSALERGALLKPKTREPLYEWLERTPAGARRIKAGLPPGTRLWHKTGTGPERDGINLCTNDAGIAALPDGSHVAIVAFLKLSARSEATRERALAEAARIVYSYWAPGDAK